MKEISAIGANGSPRSGRRDPSGSTGRGPRCKRSTRIALAAAALWGLAIGPAAGESERDHRLLDDVGVLTPVERSEDLLCPLYLAELESVGADRRITVSGTIANGGPGVARHVSVEVALVDEDGEPIDAFGQRTRPARIEPGETGTFSLRVAGGDWHRALSDIAYVGTRVRIEAAGCSEQPDAEVDAAGYGPSFYRQRALSAVEERILVRRDLELARELRIRREIDGRSERLKRKAEREISRHRDRLREIDRFLEEELPAEMAAAGAPATWRIVVPFPDA